MRRANSGPAMSPIPAGCGTASFGMQAARGTAAFTAKK
jgi:hypothetical protein